MTRALNRKGRPGLTLAEFIAAAWKEVEPATPLKWNWHLTAIADHVESVLTGAVGEPLPKVQNLLVNVPPGTMKSLIVSVFAPAWVWLWRPSWRAIFASANPRVSLRDSMRCRDLVESAWYRETFDVRWTMADDQNAKGQFKNTAGGWRLALSVGSKVTGDRADALFIDDPLDAADAPSKAARDEVTFWFDQALANRVNDLERATRIVIMQRLHEDDLSGHLLKRPGEWAHLCLPMEFERDGVGAKPTFIGWSDPRVEEGELLMPHRFSRAVLDAERTRLGSAGYAGQMQQRPVPASGNRFQRSWWRFWSPTPEMQSRPRGCSAVPPRIINPGSSKQRFDQILGSWDMSFKDGDGSDFVVGIVVGVIGADRFVLALQRGKWGLPETLRQVRQQRADWPHMWEIIVEDKANGPAVVQTLSSEITGVIEVTPEGGKEARAAALEPEVEAGNWYLPEGAEWLEPFIDEFASFPLGKNDDQVDAVSQAAIRLKGDSDEANTRGLLR